MSRLSDSASILRDLGLPEGQQNERSALTLLALAGIGPKTPWSEVARPLLRIVDIMEWMRTKFKKNYAPNSRETIRRQTIHQFEQARLIDRNPDKPSRPTNSGDTVYQLTQEAAAVLKTYGRGRTYTDACTAFVSSHGELADRYARSRNLNKVPVTLPDGSTVVLSPGEHNELQRKIVEEFASRFAPGSTLAYLGDTANKRLCVDADTLSRLAIPELNHDKLPDVVLVDGARNWLLLIEAVTSHGPISAKRHAELEEMLAECSLGRVYVTAFLDFATFKQYVADIVWESEVWIADCPDHMIHFNGQRFLGPYQSP
jgi:hypothetical protein